MIDMHSKYDNIHKNGMFYTLICINNHVIRVLPRAGIFESPSAKEGGVRNVGGQRLGVVGLAMEDNRGCKGGERWNAMSGEGKRGFGGGGSTQ